jgi:hypothetical protein
MKRLPERSWWITLGIEPSYEETLWVLITEIVTEGLRVVHQMGNLAQGIHPLQHAFRRWRNHSKHRRIKEC